MKCERCGKVFDDPVEVCDECGYDFEEGKKLKKIFKDQSNYQNVRKTDLLDNPIMSFIMGILSLILPIYLFSFIAINLAKKPYQDNLEPLSNLGKFFGYLGLLISTLVIGYLLYSLFL